jgi:cold shock CspA family protein
MLPVETQPFVPGQPTYINLPPSNQELKTARLQGIVKKFWPEKGYGFITRLDSREDVYFRSPNNIKLGSRVSFSLRMSPRGLEAINIINIKI